MRTIFFIAAISISFCSGCATTKGIRATDTEILFLKASTYAEEGSFEKAIACYDTILGLDPGNKRAFAERGFVHAINDDFDLALSDYSNIAIHDPECAKLKQGWKFSASKQRQLDQNQNDFTIARKDSVRLKDAYENANSYCGTKEPHVYQGCMDNEYFCYRSFLDHFETGDPNSVESRIENWDTFVAFLQRNPQFFCNYAIGKIGFCNFWIVLKSEL